MYLLHLAPGGWTLHFILVKNVYSFLNLLACKGPCRHPLKLMAQVILQVFQKTQTNLPNRLHLLMISLKKVMTDDY